MNHLAQNNDKFGMYTMSLASQLKKCLIDFMDEAAQYDGFQVTDKGYVYRADKGKQLLEAVFFPDPKINLLFLKDTDMRNFSQNILEYIKRNGKNPTGAILLVIEVDTYGFVTAYIERGIGSAVMDMFDHHFSEFNKHLRLYLEDNDKEQKSE